MPALVAGIHAFLEFAKQDVDARHKAGHDGGEAVHFTRHGRACHRVSRSSSWPGLSRPSTPFLSLRSNTWMPGIKPGMTVERPCISPVTAGLVTASHYLRHGRACLGKSGLP